MRPLYKLTPFLLLVALLASACSKATPTPEPTAGLPNPASVNCIQQGGTLEMRQRGELGEYGVCLFEDNLQCEEWALLRAECPVGGVKITGYATEAATYCAITGGEYAASSNDSATAEQGTCTFKNGKSCDVWEYYNGTCDANP